MDGEKNSIMAERRRFPFHGVSLVVLSVTLCACVGGLIYMSLHKGQMCQQQQVPQTVDIEADVTVKSDNQEKKEKITYNEGSNVAYYRGEDGTFEVDDFGKGIHIVRAPASKVCFVIPVGVKRASVDGIGEMIQQSAREGQITVNRSVEVSYEVLPGEIGDTSFIPQGAHDECAHGYRWMVMTTSNVDEDRRKRQTAGGDVECRYCFVFYVMDDGYYEACFTMVEFTDFCHFLYPEGERPTWIQDIIDG